MSVPRAPCPSNSIAFNRTLCACSPGYLFNSTTNSCDLFALSPSASEWVYNSGVDYTIGFPETIFSFDQIKRFTQSQAVFLEATLIMLLSWLLFCALIRFRKLGDGRTFWFQIRWMVTRLDVCFATRHWLDDQKVVRKRKTELGGTFSIASWILFIGLFAALLYQIISKRTVEVHNVKATNAPDLVSFVNDLEFNITTISTMSCSQLRGLGTLVLGSPGLIGYRIAQISTFASSSCSNTSMGPKITLRCNNCSLSRDFVFVSWQFVDVPNEPATAVGFQFNLTARNRDHKKHVSLVGGTVKNGSGSDNRPITFRGLNANTLVFNLFPRVYHNLHGLKLVQPLFHEFIPGSYISDANQLQSSLQGSSNEIVNTTLVIKFLSDYVVEIDNQNILGPVGFLADVGGLFCFSVGIFYYLLVQLEYRIKRLRNEDQVFRNIRKQRKAQDNWDKLRKYVQYRWGCKTLEEDFDYTKHEPDCNCSFRKRRVLRKRFQQEMSLHTISFDKKDILVDEKVTKEISRPAKVGSLIVESSPHQSQTQQNNTIPPPPPLPDFNSNSFRDTSEIQESLQDLHKYNAMLRDKLVSAQSKIDALTSKSSSSEGQS